MPHDGPPLHRIYLQATHSPHHYGEHWTVQYLEDDLKTPIGRMYRYSHINQVRQILHRADCAPDQLAKFEEGLRCRGVGTCSLEITHEQYKKLKG